MLQFSVVLLSRCYIPQLKVVHPEALFLIWIDCRALGLKPAALKRLFLEEAKVYVEQGTIYGAEGEGFIRINIGCPRVILETALERIRIAVDKLNDSKLEESE